MMADIDSLQLNNIAKHYLLSKRGFSHMVKYGLLFLNGIHIVELFFENIILCVFFLPFVFTKVT